MDKCSDKLTLDIQPTKNGSADIVARLGGDVLLAERVNLTKSKQRDAFAARLCDNRPGLDAAAIDALLVQEAARLFAENCCENCDRVAVLGPIPTPKPKCRGQSRWQVALRGHDHKTLVKIYVQALQGVPLGSDIKVSLDVEPVDAS